MFTDKTGVLTTKGGKEYLKEIPAGIHIPYLGFVDDGRTVLMREGSLLQVIKLTGYLSQLKGSEVKDSNARALNNLLRSSHMGYYLYLNLIRREGGEYPEGVYPEGISADFNEKWRNYTDSLNLLENNIYLTVVKRPGELERNALLSSFKLIDTDRGSEDDRGLIQMAVDELSAKVESYMNQLSQFGTSLLGNVTKELSSGEVVEVNEVMSFLSAIINDDNSPRLVPTKPISKALCTNYIEFKNDIIIRSGIEGTSYSGIVSLMEHPDSTFSGMFDKLLESPYPIVASQSFLPIPAKEARKSMRRTGKRKAASGEHERVLKDLDDAVGDLAVQSVDVGLHHLTVQCTASSPQQVRKIISTIGPLLVGSGGTAVAEFSNTEPAFWAQLPGNTSYIARDAGQVSTKNFVGFATLHNYSTGKISGNLLGSAVTRLPTNAGTSYYLNLHLNGVGHTCIFGDTESGKTVFSAAIVAWLQKYEETRTIILDNNSWSIFVKGEGGRHFGLQAGEPTNFQPWHMPDTPKNRRALYYIAVVMLEQGLGVKHLSQEQKSDVESAVEQLFDQFDLLERNWGLFQSHLVSEELRETIAPWVAGGRNGLILDCEKDELSFDHKITAIDIGWLLNDEEARAPVMAYLLYRIEQVMEEPGSVCIVIEEAWRATRDPLLSPSIEDWNRTARRKKSLVLFISQNPDLESSAGKSIYEQSATRIFFPSPKANRKIYCDGLDLSEEQYQAILTTPPESREVIILHGGESVVVRFDLSSMPIELAMLGGNKDTIALMYSIIEEYGDDPKIWVPILRKELASLCNVGNY